jgi:Rieske [2Fe-2S] domain
VVIDDTPVAIVRSGGQLYAIEDVCSHEDMALSEGEVESGTIEMLAPRLPLRPEEWPGHRPICHRVGANLSSQDQRP